MILSGKAASFDEIASSEGLAERLVRRLATARPQLKIRNHDLVRLWPRRAVSCFHLSRSGPTRRSEPVCAQSEPVSGGVRRKNPDIGKSPTETVPGITPLRPGFATQESL